jgi:heme/copper-type cytochrome/quinol oxidase subunit 2
VVVSLLKRQGPLDEVVREKQFYFIGSLFFAFTVFYAYVTFSQYFIIWNANMPEETFWYLQREKGTWFAVSMVIIFGHFFLPFLTLLRIDVKLKLTVMAPLAGWAWLMHYCDMSFNIAPVLHPEGFPFRWVWLDLGCMALIGGVLAKVFLNNLLVHPAFPQRDPRMAEGLDISLPTAPAAQGAKQAAH